MGVSQVAAGTSAAELGSCNPTPPGIAFVPGMDTLARLHDPRYYQIVVLSLLLSYGILALDFGIHWQNAVAIILTAQAVQFVCSRAVGLPRFDPLSALITSLSLTLLLRTDLIALAMPGQTSRVATGSDSGSF